MSANSRLTMAVHCLCWLELARRRGRTPLTSEEVAASLATNPVVVRRLLGELRRAGLVTASRGPGAGWSMTRPVEDVTMLDVHRALGEGPPFALHRNEPNQECPVGRGVRPALGEIYAGVDAALERELAAHTIEQVLESTLIASNSTSTPIE
ncbi:Rrf2 family transcriptional regulator [Luteipulveratus mongoliensis]|uniref:Rrf2 family transcriptional regulator n=1 Tax=Luteipulveratus mongoliensis TaxID=571913 RepID=A0A0K1JET9_9MICO|nr:Rrf2 family transcriptional regulator [Luteipulveratus mongoliensis]AKU15222.1 Rrf2 family transcriptional regulator [Luteipulveratus mongoliensis]